MAIHRRAAKRDAAEPAIVSALEALGCVVWRVSGKGLPDLVVFYRRKNPVMGGPNQTIFVADVKGPKERATTAQVEKWTTLVNLGFSVFILRTPEDAQKMLNNALQSWEPEAKAYRVAARLRKMGMGATVMVRDGKAVPRKGDAAKARTVRIGTPPMAVDLAVSGYTPPRSKHVDAANEAEETFAPPNQGMMCSNPYPCRCRLPHPWEKEAEATFAPPEPRRSNVCPDPDTMNGVGDQFPGSDYD